MKILLIVKLFSENYIYPENDLVIIKEISVLCKLKIVIRFCVTLPTEAVICVSSKAERTTPRADTEMGIFTRGRAIKAVMNKISNVVYIEFLGIFYFVKA